MEEKTKELARQWIEQGKPCVYRHGRRWKGASSRPVTKEEALKLLPMYDFGKVLNMYMLDFITENGREVLEFNELGENDIW